MNSRIRIKIHFKIPQMKDTALHRASHNGHLHTVQYLVEAGADVNSLDLGDNTPLHWAAMRGHVEIVKYLLSNGADKTVKNKQEQMPVSQAPVRAANDRLCESGRCADSDIDSIFQPSIWICTFFPSWTGASPCGAIAGSTARHCYPIPRVHKPGSQFAGAARARIIYVSRATIAIYNSTGRGRSPGKNEKCNCQ